MTRERAALLARFLADTGWNSAARTDLAGDASARRYERLRLSPDKTAIVMDAPPDTNADIRPFISIARHLNDIGLSAPRILGEDAENGFLLLEDLGDDLFARVIPATPRLEQSLYKAATDVLVVLHHARPPDLTLFGPDLMAEQACLVFETWVRPLTGPVDTGISQAFRTRFRDVLQRTIQADPVMALRDYHAENLLWLPDRTGVTRVGLLDFQDAVLAHPAYDLVSLLQDVRRDVPEAVEQAMIARYLACTGLDNNRFRTAYAVLGVQRNLRILAVFARLAGALDKPFYATLLPRPWAHLMRGLQHPALAPIAQMLFDILPRPTAANLKILVPA